APESVKTYDEKAVIVRIRADSVLRRRKDDCRVKVESMTGKLSDEEFTRLLEKAKVKVSDTGVLYVE
ncbi:MAG: hypothetical protein QXO47_10405, partial [Thermoproteota archaeon]